MRASKIYLNLIRLAQKFKQDRLEENLLQKILFFCSMYLTYQFLNKDANLFKIGDIGDKFYLILRGKLSIMKPEPEFAVMSAAEYFAFLELVKNKGDPYLVKLMINENYHLYPIDAKDIDNLEGILFRIKYKQILSNNPKMDSIKSHFKNSKINPKDYELDLEDWNYDLGPIIQHQLKILKEDKEYANQLEKYRYINNDYVRKTITVYNLKHFLYFEDKKCFGDYAIDSSSNRTATIQAAESSHLGYLDISIYREYVQIEKQRLKLKEIRFLLENFFFSINKKVFEKKYYMMFIQEELNKGSSLFKENDPTGYLYMINEGEVELTINRNILEIYQIVKNLLILNLKNNNEAERSYILKNEPKNFVDDLLRKKISKLLLCGSKEMLGLEEYFYDLNHLYQAKVVSDKAKIYKIDIQNLFKILNQEKECFPTMEKMAKQKMTKLRDRFMEIMNVKLKMIDSTVNNNNKVLLEIKCDQEFIKGNGSPGIRIKSTEVNKNALIKIKNNKNNKNNKILNELTIKTRNLEINSRIPKSKVYLKSFGLMSEGEKEIEIESPKIIKNIIGRNIDNNLNNSTSTKTPNNKLQVSNLNCNNSMATENKLSNKNLKLVPPDAKILKLPKSHLQRDHMELENKQIKKLKEEILNFNSNSVQHGYDVATLSTDHGIDNSISTHRDYSTYRTVNYSQNKTFIEKLKLKFTLQNNSKIESDGVSSDILRSVATNTNTTKNLGVALVNFSHYNINTESDYFSNLKQLKKKKIGQLKTKKKFFFENEKILLISFEKIKTIDSSKLIPKISILNNDKSNSLVIKNSYININLEEDNKVIRKPSKLKFKNILK